MVGIEEQQIGVMTGCDPTLVGESEGVGGVGGDEGERLGHVQLERVGAGPDLFEQNRLVRHRQFDEPPPVIELRQAAVGVGGQRQLVQVAAEFAVPLHRFHGRGSGRHVDERPFCRQVHGVGEELIVSGDVGGIDGRRRDRVLIEESVQRGEPTRMRSDVEVGDSGPAAEQPADMTLADDVGQRLDRRLEGAAFGDRDLPGADDLVDEHDVIDDRAGDRPRRKLVAAGVDEGGDPLLFEAAGLGDEVPVGTGDGVGAEAADHCGHSGTDDVGDGDLGSPRRISAFTTAAGDVDMRIDETGGGGESRGVDDLCARHLLERLHGFCGELAEVGDPVALDEDVLPSHPFGSIDLRPADHRDHRTSSLRSRLSLSRE